MKKLRPLDYKILFELMKNARISDREVAKALGVSQPTVSRRRLKLEKNFIEGYTVIPKWKKIGFELLAFTFVKGRMKYVKPEDYEGALRKGVEWFAKQPNVIFASAGDGMGWDGVCVSFHKNYSDYAEFRRKHDMELSDLIIDSQSFIVDINPEVITKPFHFKYLTKAKLVE